MPVKNDGIILYWLAFMPRIKGVYMYSEECYIIYKETTLSAGTVEYADCMSAGVRYPPPMRPPGSYGWWSVMLQDGILVAEQSMTQQLKWSYDLQLSTLVLTGLDGLFERLISLLVMSNPNTNIPDCILQFALVTNKYPTLFLLKGARSQWLRVYCTEIAILKTT